MPIVFNRSVEFLETLDGLPDQDQIRRIPQFFRADADMVYRLGGPFLRQLLAKAPLSRSHRYVSIDTKVHMLMPGWYACIPGWHCDDFYRPTDDQPDLSRIAHGWSDHVCVVVGPTALPDFVVEPLTLPAPEEMDREGRPLYAVYHERIEALRPRRARPASGQMVKFDCLAFHGGTPADRHTWRLFARITQSDHFAPLNEIRTQTQVYLPHPFEQW